MIWESFFSGLGTSLVKELVTRARMRDDERVQEIVRSELERYARVHPPTVVNITNIEVIIHQIHFLSTAAELKLLEQVPPAVLAAGHVNLRQRATSMYLDGNGSTAYLHSPNDGPFQDWKPIGVAPSVIKLQHRQSGKLLDAAPDREEAYLLPDNGLYQQWKVEGIGDEGFFKLRQLVTTWLLDAGTNDHTYIMENNGGDYQLWKCVNWRT